MAINYPSDEWVEKWVDDYADKATEPIKDWDAVRELAWAAWWDKEIDHNRPTPYDLSPEQEKVAKEATKGAHNATDAYGNKRKRERKPNADKREIIATVAHNLTRVCDEECNAVNDISVSNAERQIDFVFRGVSYSITLTAHRPPKG